MQSAEIKVIITEKKFPAINAYLQYGAINSTFLPSLNLCVLVHILDLQSCNYCTSLSNQFF